jgi:Domain of unknown function (DUF4407)
VADVGFGRATRLLTGVDEPLLSHVREERPRYTGLGAIVLGTAVMAALSLFDALHQVFNVFWVSLVPIALFWGAFVCMIDRWLISSTHGVRAGRFRVFLPRIVLALLFGLIIAGPLLLTLFQSAIVQTVNDQRQSQLTSYESNLRACNPLPGTPPARSRVNCADLRLDVSNPAAGTLAALPPLQAQQKTLAAGINADNKTLNTLNQIARDECNGLRGQGLSGIIGVGPNCTRDRSAADAFSAQSQLPQRQKALDKLSAQIYTLNVTIASQTQKYANDIKNAIAAQVADMRSHQGSIGLLERAKALGTLASQSAYVMGALVLVGLFVIIVDCLPVLSKMMSGTTKYDRLLDERLGSAERIARKEILRIEAEVTEEDDVALHRAESDRRTRIQEIDEQDQLAKALRDVEIDRQIAELAKRIRDTMTDHTARVNSATPSTNGAEPSGDNARETTLIDE